MDSEEQAFLVLINNYRAQNGLGPLKVVVHADARIGMEVEGPGTSTTTSRTTT